jgi:hypothetical protein
VSFRRFNPPGYKSEDSRYELALAIDGNAAVIPNPAENIPYVLKRMQAVELECIQLGNIVLGFIEF